jgi:hypothetical protein
MKAVLSNIELALCANNPKELHKSLRSLFRDGASVLEKAILKELFRRLSLPYEERTDLDFEGYVNRARELLATQQKLATAKRGAVIEHVKDYKIQPHLKVVKTFWQDTPVQISFVVTDLSKGQEYPQNFLCVFPKNLFKRNQRSNLKRSKFARTFGEKTHEVARRLLQEALTRETNREARLHIESSLKEVIDSSQHNSH